MKRLEGIRKERVRAAYSHHPLLIACQKAFKHTQAYMAPLLFSPEEVFCESILIIDHLLNIGSRSKELESYIAELWDELRIKISEWKPEATSDNLDKAVSSILYVTAIATSRSWDKYLNIDVSQWLLYCIRSNMKVSLNECEEVLFQLLDESDGIEEWINHYELGEHSLSSEIEQVAEGNKQHEASEDETFNPTGQTFQLTTLINLQLLDVICIRLTQANKLKCTPDEWRKLFSGIDCMFTMTWLGKPGELRDFFKMLTGIDGGNIYVTPKRNYLQIVRSHFVDKAGAPFKDLRKQKTIQSFKPIISDCELLLQHTFERMTEAMRFICEQQSTLLDEMDLSPIAATKDKLRIKKRRR